MAPPEGGPLRPQGPCWALTFLSQAEAKSGGLAIGATESQGLGVKRRLLGAPVLQEEEEEVGMATRSP